MDFERRYSYMTFMINVLHQHHYIIQNKYHHAPSLAQNSHNSSVKKKYSKGKYMSDALSMMIKK